MRAATQNAALGTATDRKLAADAIAALAALRSGDHTIQLGGRRVALTNVDKLMYPTVGFTKLDVARYYAQVAPVLLAHLRGRALTFKRYPNGAGEPFFYQKRCPPHRPAWVQTSQPLGNRGVEYCLPEDVPTLLWAANLADIELHVLLSRARHPQRPTTLVFDLDPGAGSDTLTCADVAVILRDTLADLDLRAFPKTSGSKGIQVYVPLNKPRVTFDDTKAFAHATAKILARNHPSLVVHRMSKQLRRGKVLIDWSQNDASKTTVCVYSLRAQDQPTVSTPLHWHELEHALDTADPSLLSFSPAAIIARLRVEGDLFAPTLSVRQNLPTLR